MTFIINFRSNFERLKNLQSPPVQRIILLAAFGCLLLSGCETPANKLAPVSGLITLDGEPLENAKVIFIPEKYRKDGIKLPYSFAITNEKGRYTLATAGGKKGAVVGDHSVVIMTKNVPEKADRNSLDLDSNDDGKKASASDEKRKGKQDENTKETKRNSTDKPKEVLPQRGGQVIPELIPPKYNSESELTFTVVAGTGNQANFSLKSSF